MERREFLKLSGMASMATMLPGLSFAMDNPTGKVLILIELNGGNDSLNTFIPFTDDAYYRARPHLSSVVENSIPLTSDIALHEGLSELLPSWDKSELAIVQGLGYEQPNRSHFRSIEIWDTAANSDEILTKGWLSEGLGGNDPLALDGLIIGARQGPLQGPNSNSLAVTHAEHLLETEPMVLSLYESEIPALHHILQTQLQYNSALVSVQQALENTTIPPLEFTGDDFSQQLALVARMLVAGIHPPVIKMSLGSFDTHEHQLDHHAFLLRELSLGIGQFRAIMQEYGLWDKVALASYSEFGRRVEENGSHGTDHGTAATHFVIGGAVNGGLYGVMPSLTQLDSGDLIYNTDFKSYYHSFSRWLELKEISMLSNYEPLTLFS